LNPKNSHPFFDAGKPRVIGHRGAMGVAPENTLVSFERAIADGADLVEFDVHETKDGHVVIIHDPTLSRTTNGDGRVRTKTLKDLKRLDGGYWFTTDEGKSYPYRGHGVKIPTLDEFFLSFPETKAIVEIKQLSPGIVANTVDTVCQLGCQARVLLATEKDRIMREIRRELRRHGLGVATGFSTGEVVAFFRWLSGARQTRFQPKGQAFQIPCEFRDITLVTQHSVEASHSLGAEMFVWTVNEVEEMKRLLGLGVDGIITDYPSLLRALIRRPDSK
jgi:glycerophosphoryl diester phosphodiesterase